MLSTLRSELMLYLLLLNLAVPSWAVENATGTGARQASETKPLQRESLEKKYARAVGLYQSKRLPQARALFDQIWFAHGDYKDTRKYLSLIDKAGGGGSGRKRAGTALLPGLEDSASAQGGQMQPESASGGMSTAEKVSRLLMDGRKAYQDGDFDVAGSKFQEAIGIDSKNGEARKYLSDIERIKGGSKFKPSASAGEMNQANLSKNALDDLAGNPTAAGKPASSAKTQAVVNPTAVKTGARTVVALGDAAKAMSAADPHRKTQSLDLPEVKNSRQIASLSNANPLISSKAPAQVAAPAKNTAATPAASKEKLPSDKSKTADPKQLLAGKPEASTPAAKVTPAQVASNITAPNKKQAGKPAVTPAAAAPTKAPVAQATSKPADKLTPVQKALAEIAKSTPAEAGKEIAKAAAAKTAAPVAAPTAAIPAKPVESARAAASKEARQRAIEQTNEGIALYNKKDFSAALEKFANALISDPTFAEADKFRSRALKHLEASPVRADERVVAAATPAKLSSLNEALGSLKGKDEGTKPKEQSDKTASSADKKSEKKNAAKDKKGRKEKEETAAKPDEAKATPAEKQEKSAQKQEKPSEKKSVDPRIEADRLFRDAQKLRESGKKEEALEAARKAVAADPNNVEAKAFVDELGGKAKSKDITAPPLTGGTKPTEAKSTQSGKPPVGVDALVAEGKSKFDSGRIDDALIDFKSALDADPSNEVAKRYISQIEDARQTQEKQGRQISKQANADTAEAAFQKGLVAYEAGRLDAAVQWWNYTLTMAPGHKGASQYLTQTRPEYDAWVQQHQYNAVSLQKEADANEKLDSPVTYDTAGQKSIVEFLSAMSLITDISFYVADGVDPEIRVTAKFEDTPLHDALDIVLLPIGLKWSRTADVVSITPDLRTKFFNLSGDQVNRLKGLLESKTLQKILYGPEGVPAMRNVELTLDDRENVLLVTDSQENVNKVEAFLKDMQLTSPPGLIYKSWKVRPEEGQKIKALVEAIIKVQSDAPYDLERKVVVDGDDLIVKDTAENVAKVEQLLLDKNFIKKLETQKLQVATFNLTPKEQLQENIEQVRDLAQNVVTVVKTILYAQSTESAAASEGRRYWYDDNTLQLTVTDYPENLRIVGDYINSLPQIGTRKQKSEIVFLKHQTAGDLQGLLDRVLNLSAQQPSQTGAAAGNSVTRTLRVEGELVFRDLRIRVTQIQAGSNANLRNDGTVQLTVRTPTTSEDRSIQAFHSEFIEDYEINVMEVRSSGNGEGSARIEVRYNPAATGVTGVGAQNAMTPMGTGVGAVPGGAGAMGVAAPGAMGMGAAGQVAAVEPVGIQVEPIENMNALLLRYTDPSELSEVKSWIEQLDIPVLQVSIETKLVEVNESRAKEWMPEFDISGIGKGGVDVQNSTLNGRFAQYLDEYRDPFDPFPEDSSNGTGLLKGTSVLSFLVPTGETPINFTLRTLESEGVVNIVNGPHAVVENGQSLDFTIERRFGALPTISNSGTGGTTGQTSTQQLMRQVDMSVTPKITQVGEIQLDISNLELNDFGNSVANTAVTLDIDGNGASDPYDFRGYPEGWTLPLFDVRTRTLQTVARVHNGGTIVLGGWSNEHSRADDSGVPILRNLPYIGHLFFARSSDLVNKSTLLIFLTCRIVEP